MTENIERGQITFEKIRDVKLFLELAARGLSATREARKMLGEAGFDITTQVVAECRVEAHRLSVLMMTLTDEFVRLHATQCGDPLTCELGSADRIEELRQKTETECIKRVRAIEAEEREAREMIGKNGGPSDGLDFVIIDLDANPSAN